MVGLCLFFGFAFFFEGVIGLSGKPLDNAQAILPYVAIGIGDPARGDLVRQRRAAQGSSPLSTDPVLGAWFVRYEISRIT